MVGLLDDRFEQALHRFLDLVLQLVNDGVQADVHFFLIGDFGGLALGAHVEADDDGVRRRGEQHVGLGDGAHARVQQLDLDLFAGESPQQVGDHFHRAAHVALQDDGQLFDAGSLDLLRQAFEREALRFGERGLARFASTVFGNLARLFALGDGELVARLRQAFQAEDFHRRSRPGFVE